LTLTELPDADQCCGFGGTFAIKNAPVSSAMLSDKITCILSTGADVCAAGDNSCLLQIDGGVTRQKAAVKCMHIAEILAATEPANDPGNDQ
jgi:L-lactate dehydrogenase complex protein LldE